MATEATTERSGLGLKLLIGAVVVVAVAFGARTVIRGLVSGPRVFREAPAREFLQRYVAEDGRVVRRDQGSDTVSEGQAYAMLLAVATDDADRFGIIWEWTQRELQRRDGLLSWHWSDGTIVDRQPASDADVDAAYALLLAGERFGKPGYTKEARRISGAVLDAETIELPSGRALVAGPWARSERVFNPSYVYPEAFRRFGRAFGDDRWDEVVTGSVPLVEGLVAGGELPPDWATVGSDGEVSAGRPSSGAAQTSVGFDAARVPVRFAASCEEAERDIAARLWRGLDRSSGSGDHASQIVAAAAAAFAAGEHDSAERLLDRAESEVRERPSYYGWALVALAPAMLDDDVLRDCPGPLG